MTVDVDGQKFAMFTKEDGAWVENAAEEASMLEAMRKGRAMPVSGHVQPRNGDDRHLFPSRAFRPRSMPWEELPLRHRALIIKGGALDARPL